MKKISSLLILSIVLFNQLILVEAQSEISLKGEWMFRLDSSDIGTRDHWFTQSFSDKVILPGSLDEQGIGVPPTEINMGRLTSDTRYVGVAWYQKKVNIPEDWKDKRICFFLERAMWETQVFVDGIYQDTRNSLSVPHIY
ncbi:MAG: hypothetical protein IH594_04235, partial [Bacteroidales bacterium]|nr:hypothetical protein [Bacteroidales bacterium]